MSTAPGALGPAAQAWKELVESREAQSTGARQPRYWDRRASGFAFTSAWGKSGRGDPFLDFLEPWISPTKTVLDVGAGAGRQAGPLAERVEWVTAVEPSEGMRALIPTHDNMTVIASTWAEAEPQKADLVICSHVLYGVAEPVPFVEKLERAARERVFVVMRDREMLAPGEQLYAVLTGRPRTRMPQLYDAFNLVRSLGRDVDVETFEYEVHNVYADLEEAVAESRHRLGAAWREDEGRAWLQANLRAEQDGKLAYGGQMVAGVVHWPPRS